MNPGAAVLGGAVGGAVMLMVLYSAIWMMPRQMKMNFLLIVGTMFVPAGVAAYAAGLMVHAMMSAAFGVIHGAILEAAAVESAGAGAALGALFGLGHALVVGVALGMMPLLHPRMAPASPKLIPAFAATASVPSQRPLDPPGYFALNYPPMTVMGFLMLHVLFGVLVGVIYGGLA